MKTPLTEADWHVLHAVATQKTPTYNQLLNSLVNSLEGKVGSNKTLLYSLKKLEFLNLVKAKKASDKLRKGYVGRKATFFKLTLEGLFLVLLELVDKLERNKADIDNIVLNNRQLLPLIFNYWRAWQTKGVTDIAYQLLRNTVLENASEFLFCLSGRLELYEQLRKSQPREIFIPPEKMKKNLDIIIKQANAIGIKRISNSVVEEIFQAFETIDKAAEAIRAEKLYMKFYFPSNMLPEGFTDFLAICREDRQLREYLARQLDSLEKTYASMLENVRNWKGWFSAEQNHHEVLLRLRAMSDR
ncbi:MAG: hypothetical protein ACQXXG_09485 [Candidatus Bathyarchaeia archaeon]|jgi:hypothetical protein|nr:hypothetical protein [Candidatus Bathyarchaeota archaeon]